VVGKVESSVACFGQVLEKDIHPFAKVGVPQFVTVLEV
jgi:hypothetical protein